MALTKPQGNMLMKLGTEQASTSGTAIDFTGIPAGTTMIVVMLEGVSTNGASRMKIQLGISSGIESSGYTGAMGAADGTGGAVVGSTDGLDIFNTTAATSQTGMFVLTLKDATNNTWQMLGIIARSDNAVLWFSSGAKSLAGVLDRVRVITAAADTFDAGSINIAYF